jgi:hypothetical protein
MPLVRKQGTVIVVPAGVFFLMIDPDYARQISCFQTRAGLSKLLNADEPSEEDLGCVFHYYRPEIEQLATALYECSAPRT